MKRFSTWLTSNKDKYSALRIGLGEQIHNAEGLYNGTMVMQPDPSAPNGFRPVPLKQARGAARLNAVEKVENLGNLLQKAVVLYWAEVCAPVYAQLGSEAAQRAMSIEWDQLLHAPGMSNNNVWIAKIDEFAKHFSLKKGQMNLWEESPMQNPAESEEGFIPEIGKGFTDGYNKPEQTFLPYVGTMQLEELSAKEFNEGAPGSAWIGLLTVGYRTGGGPHMLYLVPALHMEKHLSLPHAPTHDPVPQWGASGHHEALARCILTGRINTTKWHKTQNNPDGQVKPGEASSIGCVMGFAMVKAYNAVGHQWAFTSGTLNPTGTGKWEADASGMFHMTVKGDEWCIPKSWALEVWKHTRDLTGNIRIGRRAVVVSQAKAPPPPPPPPVGGPGRRGLSAPRAAAGATGGAGRTGP